MAGSLVFVSILDVSPYGIYNADGDIRIVIGSSGQGLYAANGAFRGTLAGLDTSTIVTTYAADGSLNVWTSSVTGAAYIVSPFGYSRSSAGNLFTYSEDLSNAAYTKATGTTVTANLIESPDGNTTADRVAESNSVALLSHATTTVVSGEPYTMTWYFKKGNYDWLRALIGDVTNFANGAAVWFDLGTGALGSTAARGTGWTVSNKTITALPNGWYRISITVPPSGTAFSAGFSSAPSDASNLRFNNGTPNGFVYAWGLMLESGPSASTYVPRTT